MIGLGLVTSSARADDIIGAYRKCFLETVKSFGKMAQFVHFLRIKNKRQLCVKNTRHTS